MTRNIIFTHGGGRLGNQLLNYANLLAFELEHPTFEVLDLAVRPYAELYGSPVAPLADITENSPDGLWRPLLRYGWGGGITERVLRHRPLDRLRYQTLHRLADSRNDAQSIVGGSTHAPFAVAGETFDHVDLAAPEMASKLGSKRVSVLAGWGIRGWPLVEKYRDQIRSHLQPSRKYLDTARQYMEPLRSSYDLVVGVLIRQDDYRTWNGGQYFFPSSEYREMIESFDNTHPLDDICYVLASDEPQDSGDFQEEYYHFATGEAVGPGHYLENFAELSLCDIVLSPPSTFSTFAAFLGDCPLVPLYESVSEDGFEQLERPLMDSLGHKHMGQSIK